jgi:hypothetical protein
MLWHHSGIGLWDNRFNCGTFCQKMIVKLLSELTGDGLRTLRAAAFAPRSGVSPYGCVGLSNGFSDKWCTSPVFLRLGDHTGVIERHSNPVDSPETL